MKFLFDKIIEVLCINRQAEENIEQGPRKLKSWHRYNKFKCLRNSTPSNSYDTVSSLSRKKT